MVALSAGVAPGTPGLGTLIPSQVQNGLNTEAGCGSAAPATTAVSVHVAESAQMLVVVDPSSKVVSLHRTSLPPWTTGGDGELPHTAGA